MKTLRGLIEPAGIDKVSPSQKFGTDLPSANIPEEPRYPSAFMRALGYTKHASDCLHHRKRLMLGSTQWTCADCGIDIRDAEDVIQQFITTRMNEAVEKLFDQIIEDTLEDYRHRPGVCIDSE